MLSLYKVLSAIAILIYSPSLLFKKGPENRRVFISERLGLSKYEKTDIWVHAVSVGEVLACLPFLNTLKKEFPAKSVVLSTTTYTGQKIAKERFSSANRIMYIPIDSELCIKRAVNLLNPEIFITVETELWPALFQILKKCGSRIVILNGRISNESFRGYRKIRSFMKKVLSYVDFFYMQDKAAAERIITLGADEKKVGVMGNFKFDVEFDKTNHLNWLNALKGGILLAASTHKGEEEMILNAYDIIKESNHDLKLILAPRHPERFSEVAEIIEKRKINYVRRSKIQESGRDRLVPRVRSESTRTEGQVGIDSYRGSAATDHFLPDIILLDTIGELSRVFSKITIAFIGGSLVPLGGHNILEPAYWSKPIIIGPYMDNFPIAKEFLDSSAALQVKDLKDIAETVTELLNNDEKAVTMGQNAKAIVDKNTGAVKKAIELIRGFIGTV